MRVASRARGILIAGIGIVVASTIDAQPAPRRLQLQPASASHPEPFTSITSVRELFDGRVLVTDGRESRMVILDFRDGSARSIGRVGRGPNEFSMPFMLRPIGADSSLMVDLSLRRWLLLVGDEIVHTFPPDDPVVRTTSNTWVRAADVRGRLMYFRTPPEPTGVTEFTAEDSSTVVLIHWRTGDAEDVARLRPQAVRREVRRDGEEITFRASRRLGPFTVEERAVLFEDGTLAIARLDPFRIDWRTPDGEWRLGRPLPVARIRIDRREREAYYERNRPSYERRPPPGVPTMPVERPDPSDFPEFIPPFPGVETAVVAGPAGHLLVRRSKSADYPGTSFFVIDRSGSLLGEFPLRANEEILGASDRHLYIGWKDEDDFLRVRRHPWPPTVSPVTPR